MSTLSPIEIVRGQKNQYPCLFLDSVTDLKPGESAFGVKQWSFNEWFALSHAEDVPSVVISESMEQLLLMTFLSLPEVSGCKTSTVLLEAEYEQPVTYGDVMTMKASLNSFRRGVATGSVIASVDGRGRVCHARYVIAVPSIIERLKPKR